MGRHLSLTPLSIMALGTAAVLTFPLLYVTYSALTGDLSLIPRLWATRLPELLTNIISLALGVSITTLTLCVSTAWVMTRYQFWGRTFWDWGFVLPLAIPSFVLAYLYTNLLDTAGPVEQTWQWVTNSDDRIPSPYSFTGALVVMTLNTFPMSTCWLAPPFKISICPLKKPPKPLMLLLDEPFSNLDPDMTIKMRKELYRVLQQTQTTAILVTHDHEEAFAMADHVAVMQDGVLVQCDTPEAIYQQPSSAFVAEFIGQAHTVPGIINNGVVETEIGTFPHQSNFHSGSRVLVMIRPNEIQFTPTETGSGHIESRQFQGSQTLYGIRLASDHLIHCFMSPIPVHNIDTVVELQVTISQTILFPQPALS